MVFCFRLFFIDFLPYQILLLVLSFQFPKTLWVFKIISFSFLICFPRFPKITHKTLFLKGFSTQLLSNPLIITLKRPNLSHRSISDHIKPARRKTIRFHPSLLLKSQEVAHKKALNSYINYPSVDLLKNPSFFGIYPEPIPRPRARKGPSF